MSIVTEIRRFRGIVEIFADGTSITRVRSTHFARYPVMEGNEIDADAYIQKLASIQFTDGYEEALTCLERSVRTARQISESLLHRGYVAPVVEEIVRRLSENRLIDDTEYARRMAELQSAKPVGIYAFKRKLRARGISEQDAEEALRLFDDHQQQTAALETARRLFRRYEGLPEHEAKAKLSQALARRGFSWDVIGSALETLYE